MLMFCRFKPLGQTPEGRRQLAATFNLCGAADAVLPDSRAAFALEMDQYGWFEGYAQVGACLCTGVLHAGDVSPHFHLMGK
jgi:hypothetical protein